MKKTRIGIVGYRGYSGAELIRILERHPHVETVLLDHRDVPHEPPIRGAKAAVRAASTPEGIASARLALVFLATPADVSMELAPVILKAGARVVDLSGGFR